MEENLQQKPISYTRIKNSLENLLGRFSLLSKKKVAGITVLILVIGIGATIIAVQRSTEYRQRASGEDTSLFFSEGAGCGNPKTDTSFSPGQSYDISICLNSNGKSIDGFDIKITPGNSVTFTAISNGTDGEKLESEIYREITNGEIRFTKATVNINLVLSGSALYLGRITLTAGNSGSGEITATQADITSSGALTVAKPTLSYTIGGTPPIATSTPTPTPTPNPPVSAGTTFNTDNSARSVFYTKSAYPPDDTGTCSTGNILHVGQTSKSGSPNGKYYAARSFLSYNTSSIPGNATISSARLRFVVINPLLGYKFTINVRRWDFGATVECADWRPNPGNDPKDGTYDTHNYPFNPTDFDINVATGGITKGGETRYYLTSDREETNTEPPDDEYLVFKHLPPPQLIVNYSVPSAPPPVDPTFTPTPTPTSTPSCGYIPDCNRGETDCSACVAETNTCNGAGARSCTFTTFSGPCDCNPVIRSLNCTDAPANCSSGYICNDSSQTCVASGPTATPTGGAGSPTPTPTITPETVTGTRIALTVGLDGIGNTGDNDNRLNTSSGNKNPQAAYRTRSIAVELYNSSETKISEHQGTLTYDDALDLYTATGTNTISLGNTPTENYIVKLRVPGYLKRRIPGIVSIVSGQEYTVAHTIAGGPNLIAGDLNNDNKLTILDWNIINACAKNNVTICTAAYKAQADYTANGVVDEFDYFLFLREFRVQTGD